MTSFARCEVSAGMCNATRPQYPDSHLLRTTGGYLGGQYRCATSTSTANVKLSQTDSFGCGCFARSYAVQPDCEETAMPSNRLKSGLNLFNSSIFRVPRDIHRGLRQLRRRSAPRRLPRSLGGGPHTWTSGPSSSICTSAATRSTGLPVVPVHPESGCQTTVSARKSGITPASSASPSCAKTSVYRVRPKNGRVRGHPIRAHRPGFEAPIAVKTVVKRLRLARL